MYNIIANYKIDNKQSMYLYLYLVMLSLISVYLFLATSTYAATGLSCDIR